MPIQTPTTGMAMLGLIRTVLDLADQQITALEHDLERSREVCAKLRQSAGPPRSHNDVVLVAAEEDLKDRSEELDRMVEERDALRVELEQARKITSNFKNEVASLQKKQERAAEKLDAAESIRLAERDNAAKEKKAADSLLDENKKLYSDLDAARKAGGQFKGSLSKVTKQLDETVLKLKSTAQLAADRQAEIDSLRVDLGQAVDVIAELKGAAKTRATKPAAAAGSKELMSRMDRAASLISKALGSDDTDQMIKDLTRAHAFVDTSMKAPAA